MMLRFAKLFEAPLVLRVFIASPDFLGTAGLPEASSLHLSGKVTWQGKIRWLPIEEGWCYFVENFANLLQQNLLRGPTPGAVNRGPDETFLELKNPPKIVEPKRQRTSR